MMGEGSGKGIIRVEPPFHVHCKFLKKKCCFPININCSPGFSVQPSLRPTKRVVFIENNNANCSTNIWDYNKDWHVVLQAIQWKWAPHTLSNT